MDNVIKLFTIGFSHKSAEEFFELLKINRVKRVIDIRFSNTSQLSGYTKKDDLKYFLRVIVNIDYIHLVELAPSEEIFIKNKNKKYTKKEFEKVFRKELEKRKIKELLTREDLESGCLLCSEKDAKDCHRRIVAKYLQELYGNIEIEDI